ncbi:MAG: alkaline shock response membrane anchor protein AmaP [Bacillota bacterium]
MQLLDRVVLTIYAVSLSVISFLILLVSFGFREPLVAFQRALDISTGRTVTGVISGFLFLIGLRFVYIGIQKAPVHALVHDTEMGQVRISLVAVKNLVTRVASRIPGVRSVRTAVTSGEEGLCIALELKVAVDANLPELADKLQKAVSSYVRDIAGVNVQTVSVSVSDIALEGRR